MDVVVVLEHHFFRTPDGKVWTGGLNAHPFWTRYLSVFDNVKVVARVRDVLTPGPQDRPASGPGVRFVAVPDYVGPRQCLEQFVRVRRAVRSGVAQGDAVIMRVSSHLAGCLQGALYREGRPFGVEVVGDPYDAYAPGAVRHPLRAIFRWWFTRQMRGQCRRACGASYVTKRALQQRYPNGLYSAGVSDVEIPDEALVTSARPKAAFTAGRRPWRLVTVGSLSQMYKATDVLLWAVSQCARSGLDLSLTIVGGGKHQPELEALASGLELGSRVRFLGNLPAGGAVRAELDAADLFVLPSRQEGLPRAMVEAMARALPCIGSNVGGIPELLPPECLVLPGDATGLATKIEELLRSPQRMADMAARNLAKAQEYRDEALSKARRAFLEHIRQATSAWLVERSATESLSRPEMEGC